MPNRLFPRNCFEFFSVKCPQCLCGHVAGGSQGCKAAKPGCFIFCAEDQNSVVRARGPILGFDGHPSFRSGLTKGSGASRGSFHAFCTLFSESKQTNISDHTGPLCCRCCETTIWNISRGQFHG